MTFHIVTLKNRDYLRHANPKYIYVETRISHDKYSKGRMTSGAKHGSAEPGL